MYSTLNHFLPLCLLTTLNGFLIYSVHARRRRHPALGIAEGVDTVWSTEQTRFTVTLIAIVGLFIVLVVPSAFADKNILLPLLGISQITEVVQVLQHISNFLMWLNMSINFLMYTAINTRFKAAFKCMIWGWRCQAHYWLCCWPCRDSDKKYYLRNYRHHHHHLHRHHHHNYRHNDKNRMKSNPLFDSNGSASRSNRNQPEATKENIRIKNNDSINREFLKTPRGIEGKEASCGRGIRAFRAYFTNKGLVRSKASEVSIPLQPSVRSSSTGTSGSSSQTPTESTEMCPMLCAIPDIPAMIEETDSLRFLPDSSHDTPEAPLPTFTVDGKEYDSSSTITMHRISQESEETSEINDSSSTITMHRISQESEETSEINDSSSTITMHRISQESEETSEINDSSSTITMHRISQESEETSEINDSSSTITMHRISQESEETSEINDSSSTITMHRISQESEETSEINDSSSTITMHRISQESEETSEIKMCRDENRNTDPKMKVQFWTSSTALCHPKLEDTNHNQTVAETVDEKISLDRLENLEMDEELPNSRTELKNLNGSTHDL